MCKEAVSGYRAAQEVAQREEKVGEGGVAVGCMVGTQSLKLWLLGTPGWKG